MTTNTVLASNPLSKPTITQSSKCERPKWYTNQGFVYRLIMPTDKGGWNKVGSAVAGFFALQLPGYGFALAKGWVNAKCTSNWTRSIVILTHICSLNLIGWLPYSIYWGLFKEPDQLPPSEESTSTGDDNSLMGSRVIVTVKTTPLLKSKISNSLVTKSF